MSPNTPQSTWRPKKTKESWPVLHTWPQPYWTFTVIVKSCHDIHVLYKCMTTTVWGRLKTNWERQASVCVCVCVSECYVIYYILSLFVLDLPDISISHSNLTVIEGDQVTAICNGSGSPLPEVDWPVNSLNSISTQQVGRTQTHNAHPYSH